MANDFNSVLATCQRFQDIATWDAEHFNANDALARIAELHKRELAAKDAEIARLKSKIEEYERQPEMMADVATEALETIKSQDAEIEDLKTKNTEAFTAVLKRDKMIRERDALIKELADALDDYPCHN